MNTHACAFVLIKEKMFRHNLMCTSYGGSEFHLCWWFPSPAGWVTISWISFSRLNGLYLKVLPLLQLVCFIGYSQSRGWVMVDSLMYVFFFFPTVDSRSVLTVGRMGGYWDPSFSDAQLYFWAVYQENCPALLQKVFCARWCSAGANLFSFLKSGFIVK